MVSGPAGASSSANFAAALKSVGVVEGFLNAASPGVITAFQDNLHYPSHEAYVTALAEVMREEYEAIVGAGFILQVDCPDLAMSHHTAFQDLTEAEFVKRAELHVEALNHALAAIPPDAVRMHICWGNYEGPHDHDIPLEKILPVLRKATPRAISFEASNPRHDHEWTIWRDARLPDDLILIPGVLDSTTNYIEHRIPQDMPQQNPPHTRAEAACRIHIQLVPYQQRLRPRQPRQHRRIDDAHRQHRVGQPDPERAGDGDRQH